MGFAVYTVYERLCPTEKLLPDLVLFREKMEENYRKSHRGGSLSQDRHTHTHTDNNDKLFKSLMRVSEL